MSMMRGQDAKATIDGVVFAFNRCRVSDRNTSQAVSNSEGRPGNSGWIDSPGFVTRTADLTEGQVELTAASYDPEFNLFGPPPLLASGFWYEVIIYPAGLTGEAYALGNCLLVEMTHEMMIPGLQPMTLRFETDGTYLLPGTT